MTVTSCGISPTVSARVSGGELIVEVMGCFVRAGPRAAIVELGAREFKTKEGAFFAF